MQGPRPVSWSGGALAWASFQGILHAKVGFEEAYGVTPRRAGSFLTCAGVGLSVAGSSTDWAPGRAPGRAVSARASVRALERARACARVCMCLCARACGEADPGIRVTPQTEPAWDPQP